MHLKYSNIFISVLSSFLEVMAADNMGNIGVNKDVLALDDKPIESLLCRWRYFVSFRLEAVMCLA